MKVLINELWKIPFLRFLTPFVFGIIAANLLTIKIDFLYSSALLISILTIFYHFFTQNQPNYHKRWIFGALMSLSIFLISYFLSTSYNNVNKKIKAADLIIGIIDEPPKEHPKSIKIVLQTQKYESNKVWTNDNSKLLIYIEKDSLSKSLKYGDLLLLKGNLQAVKNLGNPEEFDYKKYLQRKRIYFQSYKTSRQWIKLASNKGNPLYSFAYRIRNQVLAIYRKAGIAGDEFAILSALTLGIKDYLSDDIVKNYSHSGAMHVLAVSGLHVGIITMILNFLLTGFRKNPKLRIFHTIIVIVCLWIFAVITGLTPSVTRSALMFTLFVIGSNSGKKPQSLNSLAASAFIILSINPNALFYLGFQFSFLAVASILLFQQNICKLLNINNLVLRKIWELTSVSIAAQIGTTPISIYYFHQFPVYALLSNIIVIPATILIMYMTVLLLITAIFALADYIAVLLSFVISLLNKSTKFIETLPFSTVEFISLNEFELIIIYSVIVLLTIMFALKAKKLLFLSFILLIISFLVRDFRYFNNLKNNKLIFFNTNKNSAIAGINGLKMRLYADTIITNNTLIIKYLCANIITKLSINDFETKTLSIDSSQQFPVKFMNINNVKIAYLAGKINKFGSSKKMKVDYLVLCKTSDINVKYITSLFDFKSIIIDASMPKWKQNIVERECIRKNIKFLNIRNNGALIIEN